MNEARTQYALTSLVYPKPPSCSLHTHTTSPSKKIHDASWSRKRMEQNKEEIKDTNNNDLES